MDILVNAADAADVKMPLGILDLDWFPQFDRLRIRHIKRCIQTIRWLILEKEDVEKLSQMMLYCLMNHSVAREKYGNYEITINALLSKEDSLQFNITITEVVDGELEFIFNESFDSYIGDVNLLEGIPEFMRRTIVL